MNSAYTKHKAGPVSPNPKSLDQVAAPFHAAEEAFRLLVESVRDYGIFMLDPTGNIVSWNQGAERIKGYKADEIIGQHFSVFYSQADRDRNHPQHELEIASREGRYEEEGWRIKKDGSRFWANIVITRLLDPQGQLVGFAKVTRDLTERKQAEDRLRQSELQARLVYENVKDYAFITLDTDGRITGWNEGARRIKGYETQEILGKHFSIFYPQDDLQPRKCDYELSEAALTGRFEDEGWRIRKDGTRFWANVVITALYDSDHNLRGFSKVTRDITERKRSEDRLRMLNESLERRVQERTSALTEANEALRQEIQERKKAEKELQQAVQARDEFLSIASHELRTPITPLKLQMQGILNHMRRGTISEVPAARLEKLAGSAERSLSRLSKLIDSLLDVARINVGKIEIHPEPFDLHDQLQEICARLNHDATLAGSALILDMESTCKVTLDPTRLDQVVSNLLINAIKFGDGKPIRVTARRGSDRLRIEVQDQGIGIDPRDHSRIFQRFEQVQGGPENSSGLGLGLYVVKQIIEAQGGTIQVQSEKGRGSRFTVELPVKLEF